MKHEHLQELQVVTDEMCRAMPRNPLVERLRLLVGRIIRDSGIEQLVIDIPKKRGRPSKG